MSHHNIKDKHKWFFFVHQSQKSIIFVGFGRQKLIRLLLCVIINNSPFIIYRTVMCLEHVQSKNLNLDTTLWFSKPKIYLKNLFIQPNVSKSQILLTRTSQDMTNLYELYQYNHIQTQRTMLQTLLHQDTISYFFALTLDTF